MLIKNAKKQIPVTTFTTTINVEAACEVEQVTFNNVIWVSKIKKKALFLRKKSEKTRISEKNEKKCQNCCCVT